MKGLVRHWRWAALLLLVLGTIGWGGCSTTAEQDNLSQRPWNTPEGYDYNMPGGMFNQYH